MTSQRTLKQGHHRDLASTKTASQFDLLQIELNLARFASFIFAPSHAYPTARSKIWVIERNGAKLMAKILVEPVNGAILNTFDYRTFLALQKLAHESIGLRDITSFTLKGLANVMEISWGQKRRNLLKDSLRRLRKVPITWHYAFQNHGRIQMLEEPITILSKLRLSEAHSKIWSQTSNIFRFNEYIENNLIQGYRKPVFFKIAMTIRGEIALALYNFLDIVMASKKQWQRRCTALLRQDLNISGQYPWPSDRHRIIAKAVNELTGLPISMGVLDYMDLKHTRDGTDYKLIVRKRHLKTLEVHTLAEPEQSDLIEQILSVTRDPGSRLYYAKLARELSKNQVYFAISETRQAALNGEIDTSPARYFSGIANRMLKERKMK